MIFIKQGLLFVKNSTIEEREKINLNNEQIRYELE